MTRSGKPIRYMAEPPQGRANDRTLDFRLRLENRPALVHAGLGVDVMRPAQLAGILVLDIGRTLQRIRRTAHAPPRRRRFLFWHGHGEISSKTAARLAPDRQNLREAGLIEDASRQG